MNIAFIGNFSLYQVNGVSYSGYQIARQFALSNNNMYIYNFSSVSSIKRHEFGIIERTFKYSIKKLGWSSSFASFLKNNPDNIDVFHLHSVFTPYNFFTSILLKSFRFPYVLSAHGGYCASVLNRNKFFKRVYMNLFEKHILNHARGMVAVAEKEVQDLRNVGYTGSICVIPNPVVVHQYKVPVTKHDDSINIVYLGRYDIEHKGLSFLLDTFKILSARKSHIRLTLYGDGPDKEILLLKIKKENIQCVQILGPVFAEEKEFALKNATLFFQPSRWEVFGISLVEAMMLGKPVVLTEGCYLSALLQRHDLGLIVPFEPEKAASLLLNYLQSDRLFTDGARNKVFAEQEFALDKVALETLKFYLSLSDKTDMEVPESRKEVGHFKI